MIDLAREHAWDVRPIEVYARRDYRHVIAWEEGTDKSGSTFDAQIRDVRGGTLLADFAVDTTDAATGEIVLELTSEQTAGLPARCVWDLAETDPAGRRLPLLTGEVHVTGWVTE